MTGGPDAARGEDRGADFRSRQRRHQSEEHSRARCSSTTLRVTNQGSGPVDNNAVAIVDTVPANTRLFVGNLGGAGSGPVAFVNGTPSSALTWTFTALNSTTDDVDFSNDGGATWTYVPVPDANGYDAAVTQLRLRPKGTMPGQWRRRSLLRAAVPRHRQLIGCYPADRLLASEYEISG